MAVLVLGDPSVLRIKVAYLGAPGSGIRTNLQVLAKHESASDLVATSAEDDSLLYMLDLEPGVPAPPKLNPTSVRAFLYGAAAGNIEANPVAVLQALQYADAVVLVVRGDLDGTKAAF